MKNPPLAHLIIRPAKPYHESVATDISKTIAAAKKKPALGGPVERVRVAPFDFNHPLHSRHASAVRGPLQSLQDQRS